MQEGDTLFGLPIEENDDLPDLSGLTFGYEADALAQSVDASILAMPAPPLVPVRLERHFVEGRAPDGRPLHVVATIEFTPGGVVGRKGLALFAPGPFTADEARQLTARLCSQAGGLAWDVWRALL